MSSTSISIRCFVLLLAVNAAAASPPQTEGPDATGKAHGDPAAAGATIAQIFQRGQDALAKGHLDEAERAFRQVLLQDSQSGGAYANLGVVYMRHKQWTKALEMLHQAEVRLPQVAGIRLNIGLAYYRQNEFLKAIPPFESVVRDQPDAPQPRYLLGLCYFFAERWSDATATLEPLWAQESEHLPYLFVLSNAAHRASRKDLDDRATAQLIKIGDGSPEFRLFVGKGQLNVGQYDAALAEFQAAAAADPKLPFVHFNLGFTYVKKQDYPRAREEFLKDAAIEPDLALNYDELGDVYWLMQDDKSAENSYREALHRDPRLVNSHLGLARIYQRQEKYAPALVEIEAAGKIDSERTDVHYMRGQVLLRMGRKTEAKKELALAARTENERATGQGTKVGPVPSPELLQDTK